MNHKEGKENEEDVWSKNWICTVCVSDYREEVIVMSGEIRKRKMLPKYIEVRGAKVHNLKNINVDVPLNEIVAIAGGTGGACAAPAAGSSRYPQHVRYTIGAAQ